MCRDCDTSASLWTCQSVGLSEAGRLLHCVRRDGGSCVIANLPRRRAVWSWKTASLRSQRRHSVFARNTMTKQSSMYRTCQSGGLSEAGRLLHCVRRDDILSLRGIPWRSNLPSTEPAKAAGYLKLEDCFTAFAVTGDLASLRTCEAGVAISSAEFAEM